MCLQDCHLAYLVFFLNGAQTVPCPWHIKTLGQTLANQNQILRSGSTGNIVGGAINFFLFFFNPNKAVIDVNGFGGKLFFKLLLLLG